MAIKSNQEQPLSRFLNQTVGMAIKMAVTVKVWDVEKFNNEMCNLDPSKTWAKLSFMEMVKETSAMKDSKLTKIIAAKRPNLPNAKYPMSE